MSSPNFKSIDAILFLSLLPFPILLLLGTNPGLSYNRAMQDIGKVIKVSTLLGIVTQLYESRMGQHLGKQNINYSQFALLNHLARHQHLSETISDLVKVMEMNQPGVTKAVQKLTRIGLVETYKDESDGRKKYVRITPAGQEQIGRAMAAIGPDVVRWFEDWSAEEMDQFISHLERLSWWLDENRLEK